MPQSAVSKREPKGHIPTSRTETPRERQRSNGKLAMCIIGFIAICLFLPVLEQLERPLLVGVSELRFWELDMFLMTMGFFGFEFFFVIIPLTCFAVSLQNNRRKLSFGFDLILLLTYTWLIGSLIKSLFHRDRPYQLFTDVDITPLTMRVLEYSFPSGHSCGSMVCWSFMYDRLRVGMNKQQRRMLYALTWVLVGLASGSRFYFCVHFPHDIIGGWLLAFIIYRVYSDWDVLPSTRAIVGLFAAMLVTCAFSPMELLLHMPGLLMCTSMLMGMLFCLSFSTYLPRSSPLLNLPISPSPLWKRTLRVILGCLLFTLVGALQELLAGSVYSLFAVGFLMSVWLLWIAPGLFGLLRLY